jgi:hypothetical protein
MKRSSGLKRKTPLGHGKRRPISPASPAQRAKVAMHSVCVGCGRHQSDWLAVDPAHLCDRSLGGCDDEACVVGLCRTFDGTGCHKLYDEGKLDLLPMLEPAYRREQAHAVMHLGLLGAYKRLTNDRHAGAHLHAVPEDAA